MRLGRAARPERIERLGRVARSERIERLGRPTRPERIVRTEEWLTDEREKKRKQFGSGLELL